jgi:hypothetical protein
MSSFIILTTTTAAAATTTTATTTNYLHIPLLPLPPYYRPVLPVKHILSWGYDVLITNISFFLPSLNFSF